MVIKHFARGKFYQIACPEGRRVEYRSGHPEPGNGPLPERLIVPWQGREIAIPAEPSELLPILAEAGRCGLALLDRPEAGPDLANVTCPECGERDIDWLSIGESEERVHCDRCDAEFGSPSRIGLRVVEVRPRHG